MIDHSWKLLLGVLALIVLSVVIRVPFFNVPMITDEGGCAYVAHFWTSDYQPYKDINYDRFQGLFLIYKAILAVLGPEIDSIRLGAALYNSAAVLGVFLLARLMGVGLAGWIAGILFALFSAAPAIEGFTANSELFAVLPLTFSAYFSWKQRWFLAGLLSGFAVLFKPIGISGFLLALIWVLLNRWKWRSTLSLSLGFAIGPGLAAFHGWLIGWKYFLATFVKHRAMAFSIFSSRSGYQLGSFFESIRITSVVWIVLAILALIALVYSGSRVRLFGLSWIGASIFGMALGGNWFPHYYVQIIPPLAVLGGIGAASFVSMKKDRRILWSAPLVLAFGIFTAFQGGLWFAKPDEISLSVYDRPAYLVSKDVGRYIAGNTRADDLIYVAFGQADIYYHARRKAAVPQQLYWHQIAANKDLWDEVVACIKAKIPAMIIWVQYVPPSRWSTPEAFEALLDEGYDLDRKYPFLEIYRRR